MPTLDFDREKSNLGGINEFAFILESQLETEIEIIKGQVVNITISVPGFKVASIVQESGKFYEDIKSLNLFEYKFTARIGADNYNKLLDCGLFDTNKIIALVKDNNNNTRVIGNKNNACELKLSFDKGSNVADLNHYKIELEWKSKYRAPILSGEYIVPIYIQDENAEFIAPENSIADNKISSMDKAETIENGFCYIILPDPENPGKYKSYKFNLQDFINTDPFDFDAIHVNGSNEFFALEEKYYFSDNDIFIGENSESLPYPGKKFNIYGSEIKSTLKDYFDTLYFETFPFAASDENTVITTGTAKISGHWPFNFELESMFIGLSNASSSGSVTIDINDNAGNSIFSTRPTILANEKTSLTNSTQPVLATTSFVKGDAWSVDFDLAGTGAKGVKIYFKGTKS